MIIIGGEARTGRDPGQFDVMVWLFLGQRQRSSNTQLHTMQVSYITYIKIFASLFFQYLEHNVDAFTAINVEKALGLIFYFPISGDMKFFCCILYWTCLYMLYFVNKVSQL